MASDATATPDIELPVNDDGTPEGEPAAELTPEAAPADQPAAATPDPRLAQAEYTRSQQAFGVLKEQLGLPRTATRDEVLAAVAELRNGGTDDEEDDEPEVEEDPRVQEYARIAFEARLDTARAIYGQDFVDNGIEVINLLRQSEDPNELMVALAGFRDKWAGSPASAGGPAESIVDNTAPAPIGLPETDGRAAPQPLTESQARREPGPVGAIRGLFEAAGIATRPRAGKT